MSTWYEKKLGNGIEAFEPTKQIQDAWYAAYLAASAVSGKQPYEMAVFSHHAPRADMVTAYFTPGASELALRFGATACAKPLWDDCLGLMCGDVRALDIYFPGR